MSDMRLKVSSEITFHPIAPLCITIDPSSILCTSLGSAGLFDIDDGCSYITMCDSTIFAITHSSCALLKGVGAFKSKVFQVRWSLQA